MQTLCIGCEGSQFNEPRKAFRWDAGIVKLAIALLVAGQSMVFSLAINITPAEEPVARLALQGLIFAATLIVLALLGGPLIHVATTELRRGRLTIEVLFLTTII